MSSNTTGSQKLFSIYDATYKLDTKKSLRFAIGVALLLLMTLLSLMTNHSIHRTQLSQQQKAIHESATKMQSQISNQPKLQVKGSTMQSTDSANQSSANTNKTSVVINGQNVPVPANGIIHQTTSDGTSRSQVDISVNNSQSGAGTSQSNTNINISTNSHTSTDNP